MYSIHYSHWQEGKTKTRERWRMFFYYRAHSVNIVMKIGRRGFSCHYAVLTSQTPNNCTTAAELAAIGVQWGWDGGGEDRCEMGWKKRTRSLCRDVNLPDTHSCANTPGRNTWSGQGWSTNRSPNWRTRTTHRRIRCRNLPSGLNWFRLHHRDQFSTSHNPDLITKWKIVTVS